MKWLTAGLIFVSLSTVGAVFLGFAAHGLGMSTAAMALMAGALLAMVAYVQTNDPSEKSIAPNGSNPFARYRSILLWLLGLCFAMFAVRVFCWLIYIDGDQLKIQSPNNLGDLALHITYIRNFASGVPFWPDNPIYISSKLRYPVGIDLFNALLVKMDVDLIRGLVWVALLASVATFYAFYRWGGAFGIAGFLFNGGIIGFQFLSDHQFIDYQDTSKIAWKSIPLTMFVTQRGLLYAIPAGLLLLWHWREKFFPQSLTGVEDPSLGRGQRAGVTDPDYSNARRSSSGPLPWWVELSLYASMPLFHFHTFLALSIVLLCFLISECVIAFTNEQSAPANKWTDFFDKLPISKHALVLVACSLLPATFFVWLTTDEFHAGSIIGWQPGWVQAVNGDELAQPFFIFWLLNFGLWVPIVLTLFGLAFWRARETGMPRKITPIAGFLLAALTIFLLIYLVRLVPWDWDNMKVLIWANSLLPFIWRDLIAKWLWIPIVLTLFGLALCWVSETGTPKKITPTAAFLLSALSIFLLAYLVRLAPWGWDNMKVLIWAYFLVLPFLWSDLIAKWPATARIVVCAALFGSGFVSLFGGLAVGNYGFAGRAELDLVSDAVRSLPVEARFAAFPTYNHPLLLNGRKLVMGYPGHLWTQGFADYGQTQDQLRQLMQGSPQWQEIARRFGVRYIFWGREEELNYPLSTRPWEKTALQVKSGQRWGSIYDLAQPPAHTTEHEQMPTEKNHPPKTAMMPKQG